MLARCGVYMTVCSNCSQLPQQPQCPGFWATAQLPQPEPAMGNDGCLETAGTTSLHSSDTLAQPC